VSEPRLWWQDVMPSDWTGFRCPRTCAGAYTALLAALEDCLPRPMSTLGTFWLNCVPWGFHDPLHETELRDALDNSQWGFAEPFRNLSTWRAH